MAHSIHPSRHPLNQGDFYSLDGSCTNCGAPQAEAPGLILHTPGLGHCYFRQQPITREELDQAIRAMMVACTDALRYGGIDEQILKRLYENGMSDLCDHAPQQAYPVVVRNRVTFTYTGAPSEMAAALVRYLQQLIASTVIREQRETPDSFQIVHRWAEAYPGTRYEGRRSGAQEITIVVQPERATQKASVGRAGLLYDFLRRQDGLTRVRWWPADPAANEWYEKPF